MFISADRGSVGFLLARTPFQNRVGAILGILCDALRDRSLPNQRFLVNIGDRPLTRLVPWRVFGPAEAQGHRDIAAPDFVFGGWPEAGLPDFDSACASIANAGQARPETSLMGWYGNVATDIEARQRQLEIAKLHSDLVEAVDVGNWFARGERLTHGGARTSSGLLTLPNQVLRFRFLIDVEGVGYSARLPFLLHSGRAVFIQDRPWRQGFYNDLRAWEHYVPVERDLSNLIVHLQQVLADPQLEQKIAEGGRRFAEQHLTREAAVAAWRNLLSDHRTWRPFSREHRHV